MKDPHGEGQSPWLHWGRVLKVSALGCSEVALLTLLSPAWEFCQQCLIVDAMFHDMESVER